MRLARWGEGSTLCPRCGFEASWFIGARRQWRCKNCGHTYSVTSGTPFADHKLPLKVYLAAILLFANAVKGLSSLQLARDLGVQQKTAYVLLQKLRESLLESRDPSALKGEVEVDGGYTGGYVRPENRKTDRDDRRSSDKPNKRCVLVLRQRGEHGAARTVTEVIMSENGSEVAEAVTGHVAGGAELFADENAAYDALAAWYETRRVNHSIEYSAEDGSNTNQAESYFARFRRLVRGQVHRMSEEHLDLYANEIAYREDTRRWANGHICRDVLSRVLAKTGPSLWRGYWGQRTVAGLAIAA